MIANEQGGLEEKSYGINGVAAMVSVAAAFCIC